MARKVCSIIQAGQIKKANFQKTEPMSKSILKQYAINCLKSNQNNGVSVQRIVVIVRTNYLKIFNPNTMKPSTKNAKQLTIIII